MDYDIRRTYNGDDFWHPDGAEVRLFSQELVDDINEHVAKAMGLPKFERSVVCLVNENVYKAIVDRCTGSAKPYVGVWVP